jgi:hypothetical protein
MKEIKGFTPGPWGIAADRYLYANVNGNFRQIATFDKDDDWEEEQSANKEIIAAAPELYAECWKLTRQREELVKALEMLWRQLTPEDFTQEERDMVQSALLRARENG